MNIITWNELPIMDRIGYTEHYVEVAKSACRDADLKLSKLEAELQELVAQLPEDNYA